MKKLLLILPVVLNVMLAGCSPAKTETSESNQITSAIPNSKSFLKCHNQQILLII